MLACGLWADGPKASPERGDPFLRVYPAREYGAFFQNWDIIQDSRGLIYAGNNAGVLEYDGVRWRLIPTAKRTVVVCLAEGPGGVIFVGALGEMGYLKPDARGQLVFQTLMDKVRPEDRLLSVVNGLQVVGKEVYFQTRERIFRFRDGQYESWKPEGRFQGLWASRGQVYTRDSARGLRVLQGDQWRDVEGADRFRSVGLAGLQPWDGPPGTSPGLLVATEDQGLFLLDGPVAKPFHTQADALLKAGLIQHLRVLSDGSLALGTLKHGLVHLSREGAWVEAIGKLQGFPDEGVKKVMQDAQGGVWVVLGKGLARVELLAPLTSFGDSRGLLGTPTCCLRHKGQVFVGTDQGLFVMKPETARFEPLGVVGAVWDLMTWDDELVAAAQGGLIQIRDRKPNVVWSGGRTVYHLLRSRIHPERLLLAGQDGLDVLRRDGATWRDHERLASEPAVVRSLVEMDDGTLWLGTFSGGVSRMTDPWGAGRQIRRFGVEDGLPSGNHTYVYELGGQLRATSHSGLFRFRHDLGRFEPDPDFRRLFPEGPRWLYAPAPDSQGRIWMHSCSEVAALNASGAAVPDPGGGYRWDGRPVVRASGGWVESVYPEPDGVVWFCGSEGLVRLDSHRSRAYGQDFATLIRGVQWGQGQQVPGQGAGAAEIRIPFSHSQLRFEFALPSYDAEWANRYQVMLEGFDREWTAWGPEAFRDYTNLREGHYRFRVRGRNLYGTAGREAVVMLTIQPPWFRSWWAYAGYLAGAGVLGRLLVRWRYRVLEQENRALEGKVRERTEHLEKLNAIVEAVNGSLELDSLLGDILRETQVIHGAERASALVREAGGDAFRFRAWRGEGLEGLGTLEMTLAEAEARYTREAQEACPDIFVIRTFDHRPMQRELASYGKARAILAVRIQVQDRTEGFFVFDNTRDPDAFDQRDIELLWGLRNHFVTAMMKARSLEELRRARDVAEQAGRELQAANERLNHLNDEKNRIIGVAAHDLRNPLSGVLMSCELLKEDASEGLRLEVERIQELGRGMNALIQDLLDVNAIEANATEVPVLGPVDLEGLLADACCHHRAKAEAKRIALVLEPGVRGLVLGDDRQLRRVLDNLVSNAVKYSPPGRGIEVCTVDLGSRIRLEVRDHGPGLTDEDKTRVFGTYARLSARPTAGEPSVGLGLSIVKCLVEGMGGEIGVESTTGEGATFWVTLDKVLEG